MERLFIYMVGAAGYGLLEVLWRGYTHWTMQIVGGLCFFVVYYMYKAYSKTPTLIKAVAASLIITVIELFAGICVNIILGWQVWDYSDVPYNILGQICLPYSFLWFVISVFLVYFCKKLRGFTCFLQKNVDKQH